MTRQTQKTRPRCKNCIYCIYQNPAKCLYTKDLQKIDAKTVSRCIYEPLHLSARPVGKTHRPKNKKAAHPGSPCLNVNSEFGN